MDVYLDCAGGVSGHALLAALADLGVAFQEVEEALRKAGLPCHCVFMPAVEGMGTGHRVDVILESREHLPRRPSEIAAIFSVLSISQATRTCAVAVLDTLVGATARAFGIASEDVCFSSEEAMLTMIVPAVCYGLEQLGVTHCIASSLPWPKTTAEEYASAQTSPVTARLLLGKPVFSTAGADVCVTPLGVAFLDALVDEFVPAPNGVLQALGTGYGMATSHCCLRVWHIRPTKGTIDHSRGGREPVMQLETHVDHLNGEDLGLALTELMAMPEVLDVLWLPGVGKKNRPAGLLRVLCFPEYQDSVVGAMLRHTHTLGLRMQILERLVLPRTAAHMSLAGENLAAKRYTVEGHEYVRPEADSLAETARRLGVGVPALRNTLYSREYAGDTQNHDKKRVAATPRELKNGGHQCG